MAKYIMIYRTAQPFDMSLLPKDKFMQAMQEWGEWIGRMGPAVVSPGDAFKFGSKSVGADDVKESDNLTSGYSIVEAKNFDEALGFAQTSPVVKYGGRVEIYEAFGTQEMAT
jgi:hypothetical protein